MAQKDMQNERIFRLGTIVPCTKSEVITIGLGEGKNLAELVIREDYKTYHVFHHDGDGHIIIPTKEQPNGCDYDENLTVVVRVLGGKVLINGLYDIYCPAPSKLEKLLSNPIVLEDHLDADQLYDLEPVLLAGSDIRPSLAPAEPGRRVIRITYDMVNDDGIIMCHCPWDSPNVFTNLYEGDYFLVEDDENYIGYRIGKEEFELTHKLD